MGSVTGIWDTLLANTCLWCKEDTELLKTFKELREAGAELHWKTVRDKSGETFKRLFLRRGKVSKEDWQLIKTLKLEPHTEQIKLIFEITSFGEICDIKLAKPLPENAFSKVLRKYFQQIVDAKEKKEFTIQLDNGKLLTVVPRRTRKDRTEVTVEELYTLKWLTDEGYIRAKREVEEWVRWS